MKRPGHRQQGATLIITLTLLVVILLLGTASVRLFTLDQHAARNHRTHLQARLAAQAALDDALLDLRHGRVALLAGRDNFPADVGCRRDNSALCRGGVGQRAASIAHLTGPHSASLGQYSRHLELSAAARATTPRYLIELIPGRLPDGSFLYRISAVDGEQPRAALQLIVRSHPDDAAPPILEAVGWRHLPVS